MRYVLGKAANLIFTMLIVSLIIFFVFQILPGDPAELALGPDAEQSQLAQLREEMGLNKPAIARYGGWIAGLFSGNPGVSMRFRQPVAELIAKRLPVTFSLSAITLLLTAVISLPISAAVSKNRKSPLSRFISAVTQLGLAIPTFWLSMMLALAFAVRLRLVPAIGYVPIGTSVSEWFSSLIIPAAALAVGNSAYVIRFLRNSIADELEKDYVKTARSKGMKSAAILYGVVLRNALIPVVTVFGMIVVDTLGGSIIVEHVFNLPGLGSLLTLAVGSRDFILLQSLVLYISGLVVALNFVVDILYRLIDPRIAVT